MESCTKKRIAMFGVPTLSAVVISVLVLVLVHVGQFSPVPESENGLNPSSMTNENPLTSHILDTASGRPAANVSVKLFKRNVKEEWELIIEKETDHDGRLKNMIAGEKFTPAVYKLYFDTATYFRRMHQKTFYPYIEVVFEIEKPEEHYHVPILLSPYGYSTYRGS